MKAPKIVFLFAIIFTFLLTNATNAQSWKELDSLGLALEEEGKYKEAIQTYEKALIQAEKEFGKENENYIITSITKASIFRKQGIYKNADEQLNNLLPKSEKLFSKDHRTYVITLIELSILNNAQGLYSKAESLINEAITILKNTNKEKSNDYANALSTLAHIYTKQELYEKAIGVFNQALTLRKSLVGEQNPYYASDLNGLAFALSQESLINLSKAEAIYLQSLQILKEKFGTAHPSYMSTLNNLGVFYTSQNKYAIADIINAIIVQTQEKIVGNMHLDYILALDNAASALFIQNKYIDAQPLYIKSITAKMINIKNNFTHLSELEKISFIKANYLYFENFYIFLKNSIENPQNNQDLKSLLQTALNLQLQTKGMLLSETSKMKKRILASGDTALINQFEKWQAVKNSIAKAYNLPIAQREKQGIDISKLENEANELERGLSARSVDFQAAFNPPTYTYQDIQKKLRKNEVAIELIRIKYINTDIEYINKDIDDFAYVALLVTKSDIKPVLIKNATALESTSFITYKRGINLQSTDTLSYTSYWGEIEKNLPASISKIYLCLDGVYHQLNLGTLFNPKTKKYLIESTDIQQVTNLKEIITNPQKVTTTAKSIALFGYPNYELPAKERRTLAQKQNQPITASIEQITPEMIAQDSTRTGFGNLLNTKEEVETIAQLATENQWKASTYLKNEALEENVKAINSPRILHIATHGYFNPNVEKGKTANPLLRSGLLLAGAAQTLQNKEQVTLENITTNEQVEDGVLTAYEVMNLNLDQTDLVVLSACETGLGEIQNGEGVYGLQRAFIVAGAKSLIISLWKVSDAATSELMTTFYKHYLKSGNKRAAFQKAQKQVRKTYKSPYFWGAFVMIGD